MSAKNRRDSGTPPVREERERVGLYVPSPEENPEHRHEKGDLADDDSEDAPRVIEIQI